MNTHHQNIDRARTDPAHGPTAFGGRPTARLPGVVGLGVIGLTPGMPAGFSDPGWVARAAPLTHGAVWLTVTVLCLGVLVGLRQMVAFQAAGRRVRVDGRRWGIARWPSRRTQRTHRTASRAPSVSGCRDHPGG